MTTSASRYGAVERLLTVVTWMASILFGAGAKKKIECRLHARRSKTTSRRRGLRRRAQQRHNCASFQ
jgi:hypothetical protein